MASVDKRTWTGADNRERVRWVAAYKDQHGRRHNRGFKARKDARAFLILTEGEIVRGVHTPESSSITVTEAAALWLKRSELEQLERSTLRQYDNHVTRHILPLLGSVKLAKLSTPVVQLFRDKLLEKLDIAQLINAAKPRSKRRCSCTQGAPRDAPGSADHFEVEGGLVAARNCRA